MRHATTAACAALMILLFATPKTAKAGDVELPITVTLIQCGQTKADIPRACKKDGRCCVFMDQAPMSIAKLSEPIVIKAVEAPKPIRIAAIQPPKPALKPVLKLAIKPQKKPPAPPVAKKPEETEAPIRIAYNIWDYVD